MLEKFGLNINFVKQTDNNADALVILINDSLTLSKDISIIDKLYNGIISKAINNTDLFKPKFDNCKVITTQDTSGNLKFLILIGLGKEEKLSEFSFEKIGGKIFDSLMSNKISSATIIINQKFGKISSELASSLVANGLLLASYKFDKYFTNKKEEDTFQIQEIIITTPEPNDANDLLSNAEAVTRGVFLARDCISEPANILYPASYANIVQEELTESDITVEILGENEMRKLRMGALLGVAQGSQNEAKLVIMRYMGSTEDTIPIALVGKGVTFDTGGISIKPRANMGDMKYDMAGSAAVVGTLKALALRKAKINVVGVIGLVENMPGGNAQRPGDVVTTMSGKTAEVVDTDAEGRLVLADAVWYTQEHFKPSILIDLATLTGAIRIALGSTYAGIFSNDDELADKLIKAGNKIDEKLWRMPLHQDYDDMIKSPIADIANLADSGQAGSSTAAHFIKHFIQDNTKWAHLDIASVAWIKTKSNICPKGAVGFGVRLLNKFIQDNYESK